MKRISFVRSLLAVAALAIAGSATAQDIKERTIKFGVAGPDTHPAAAGMKKFAPTGRSSGARSIPSSSRLPFTRKTTAAFGSRCIRSSVTWREPCLPMTM